jgi:hypothetical protein
MKGLKTSFIKHINMLGALVKPNDISNHSYKSNFILNVVFPFIPNFHSNMLLPSTQIDLGENNNNTKLIKHIIKVRNMIAIVNCDIVNRSTIDTHAPRTILLWNK